MWSVQKISLLARESKKYGCFFITIIPLNFLLGRVISYSEGKIGESIHLLLRLLPGRLNPSVFQSVVTGKCLSMCIVMLLSKQGARKNWNQVKLVNTNVSAK